MARDWIDMLVDLAREQERAVPQDPRFDALVEGSLPDPDKHKLEQEAATSVKSARILAAFTPLDKEVKDRMALSAHTVLTNLPTGERDPLEVWDELDDPPNNTSPSLSTTKSKNNTGFILLLVVAFVLAAAMAAYLTWPSGDVVPPMSP